MLGRIALVGLLGFLGLILPAGARAQEPRGMVVYLHGRAQPIHIWKPRPGAPRRAVQVLVVSGDLGWLGISDPLPRHLQKEGYRVVGLNSQSYMAHFTGGRGGHLQVTQIPHDFDVIMEAANVDLAYPTSFVVVGVSEGAGLGVLAMGQPGASDRCRGVIGLGLPMLTSLGWRWVDLLSEISRKEPPEAEAETTPFLAALRVPLVLIHSMHDEYDSIDKVRAAFAVAPEPKRFIAVDGPNHRFSHHTGQVLGLVDRSIAWFESLRPTMAQLAR